MLTLTLFFFFNDTATTEIYTLSLHDALPISCSSAPRAPRPGGTSGSGCPVARLVPRTASVRVCTVSAGLDRKSTRLNSSHSQISYAVFCLKKKTQTKRQLDSQTSQRQAVRQA